MGATASLRRKCRLGAGLAFAHKYNDDGGHFSPTTATAPPIRGRLPKHEHGVAVAAADLFVCENNRYAMGTSNERAAAVTDYRGTRQAFGIPGRAGDGMDVEAWRRKRRRRSSTCARGKGPYVLESMTYRYRGHSMSDPAKYRTKEEVQKYRPSKTRSSACANELLRAVYDEAGAEGDRQGRSKPLSPSPPTSRQSLSPSLRRKNFTPTFTSEA